MNEVLYFNNVGDYNKICQQEISNQLVSILDLSKSPTFKIETKTNVKMCFGFYGIFLKDNLCGEIKYGRQNYDYQEGTLVFVGPNQFFDVEYEAATYQPQGHVLIFHPELIKGTSLSKKMDHFSFFSYQMNEALHISDFERKILFDSLANIQIEMDNPWDKHSKKLIAANIELFLNYCYRFYDRQFTTRIETNKKIVKKFEKILNTYFYTDNTLLLGLPSVGWSAKQLNLSKNYFSDLIKKETGQSAQEFIQNKLIEVAKDKLFNREKSINEISYELGFKYPQHFIRLFKEKVGATPNKFRSII